MVDKYNPSPETKMIDIQLIHQHYFNLLMDITKNYGEFDGFNSTTLRLVKSVDDVHGMTLWKNKRGEMVFQTLYGFISIRLRNGVCEIRGAKDIWQSLEETDINDPAVEYFLIKMERLYIQESLRRTAALRARVGAQELPTEIIDQRLVMTSEIEAPEWFLSENNVEKEKSSVWNKVKNVFKRDK